MKSSLNKVLVACLMLAFFGGHAFGQAKAKVVPKLEKCAKGNAGKACRDAKSKKTQAVSAQSGKAPAKLDSKTPAAKPIKQK